MILAVEVCGILTTSANLEWKLTTIKSSLRKVQQSPKLMDPLPEPVRPYPGMQRSTGWWLFHCCTLWAGFCKGIQIFIHTSPSDMTRPHASAFIFVSLHNSCKIIFCTFCGIITLLPHNKQPSFLPWQFQLVWCNMAAALWVLVSTIPLMYNPTLLRTESCWVHHRILWLVTGNDSICFTLHKCDWLCGKPATYTQR